MLDSKIFLRPLETRRQRFLLVLALLPALALLSSCGSSNTSPPTISVAGAASSINVSGQVQFTATIENLSSTLVTWQVQGVTSGNSTYGTINTAGLYTAPATIPNTTANVVTITAVAEADTALYATANLTILPPPVITSITPGCSPVCPTVPAGTSQAFAATVSGGGSIAVYWYVDSSATCINDSTATSIPSSAILNGNPTLGMITNPGGNYTAPLIPPPGGTVTIYAVSQVDTSQFLCVPVTLTYGNASLQGPFAFSTSGRVISTNTFFARAGGLTADGSGNIVGGLETYNQVGQAGGATPHTFLGSYTIGPDGRGTMQFCEDTHASTCAVSAATVFFRLVVISASQAQIIEFSPTTSSIAPTTASGQMNQQDISVFNAGGLAGAYSFDFSGFIPGPTALSAVGEFSSNGIGGITSTSPVSSVPGRMDVNNGGALSQPQISNTSTYSITGNGQGTATLLTTDSSFPQMNFTIYMISASHAKFIESDANAVLVGDAYKQQTNSCDWGNNSLNSSIVFETAGSGPNGNVTDLVSLNANGAGMASAVSNDENNAGTVTSGTSLGGNYAIDSCGRGTLSLGSPVSHTYSFYPISSSSAVIQETTTGIVGHGFLVQPQSGLFTFEALNSFALNLAGTNAAGSSATREDTVGQFNASMNANDTGSLTANTAIAGSPLGTFDINNSNGLGTTQSIALISGSLSVGGRSTMALTTANSTQNFVLYMVGPTQFYVMSTNTTGTAIGSLYNQF